MDRTQLSALADASLAGGVFALGPEEIDDTAVRALFRAFLSGGVRLGGATRLPDGPAGEVRVEGRTMDAVLSLPDVSAALEMGLEADAPYLSLRLSALPLAWTPAASFPRLARSVAEAFAWEGPVLTLDSRIPGALPAAFEADLGHLPPSAALRASLRRGLSLEATLRPGPALGRMGWVLGMPRVWGAVEATPDGAVRMWLRGALGEPLTLGTLTVPVALELASVLVSPDAETVHPYVSVRLASEVSFESGGSRVAVPLAAAFGSPRAATLALSGRPGEACAVLLSALPSLLGDLPLGDLIPADGPDFDALTLDRVELCIETARPWLMASSARVALAEPWRVGVGGLDLTVRSLAADFTAATPRGAPATFGAALTGTVALGGTDAAMDGRIALPGLELACGLAAGSEVDLTALLAGLLPELAAMPRLVCTALELSGAPRSGRYELSARLAPSADPWVLDVGVASLLVRDAYLAVARAPGAGGGVTGQAGGVVEIAGVELCVDWALPGGVELRGELPAVSMRALAEALCGGFADLPPGFPDLVFEDALVQLSAGERRYEFSLGTEVRVGSMELGGVLFEVRTSPAGTGFLAGFVVPARWTPADLWSELAGVFGGLVLRDPGLIVSSIETAVPAANLAGMGALPARIVPGVSFFAALELEGALAPVRTVLGGARLNLSVVIANDVRQTRLVAATGAPASAGSVAFDGFSLVLTPASPAIDLRSGTTLTVGGDVLDFSLAGVLEPTGALTAALSLRAVAKPGGKPGSPEAGWSEPFGLPGLTVHGLGGALSVAGEGWSIALEGSFAVGAGGEDDRLAFGFGMQVTNGALPSAAVASLRSAAPGGVTLTRMVRGFTSLDLADYSVPVPAVPAGTPGGVASLVPVAVSPAGVLDQVVLRMLSGFLVLDPTGFRSPVDPTFVYRGVGFHADGSLFGLGIRLDLDLQYTTGVYARGALSKPIDLFGVVKVSDAAGKGGAAFVVDTKQIALGGDLLVLSGAVAVLGAKARLDGCVRRDRLEFDLSVTGVPGIRTGALRCSLVVPTSFDAAGVLEAVLEGDVPLKAGGVDLGTLHLSGTAAHVELSVGAGMDGVRLSAAVRAKLASDLPEIGFSFVLAASFRDLAGLAAAVLNELRRQGWRLVQQGLGGVEGFLRVAEGGALSLASGAATVLRHGYGMAADEAARTLRAAGRAAAATARELEAAYGAGADAVGGALKKAGFALGEVEGALRSAYALDVSRVLPVLRRCGYAAADVARHYRWAEKDAANLFRTAGYTGTQAGQGLRTAYGSASKDAAKLMERAGYSASDTARALKSVFEKSSEQAGKILKEAGYRSGEIAEALKDVCGWSAKKTSKFMKETLGYGKDTVKKAMRGAGYSENEIEKAFDDLWGDVKGAVDDIF